MAAGVVAHKQTACHKSKQESGEKGGDGGGGGGDDDDDDDDDEDDDWGVFKSTHMMMLVIVVAMMMHCAMVVNSAAGKFAWSQEGALWKKGTQTRRSKAEKEPCQSTSLTAGACFRSCAVSPNMQGMAKRFKPCCE
jgi:hypothetical protein